MPAWRVCLLSVAHASIAAYCGAVALEWLAVSDGRAGLSSLFWPGAPLPGQGWAAALAGAVLGPILHRILSRLARTARRPGLVAASAGIAYAMSVLVLATMLWLPAMIVAGRAPGESLASALAGAAFVIGFGTPIVLLTGAVLFAPVLIVGGAAVGLTAMAIERRYLPTIS